MKKCLISIHISSKWCTELPEKMRAFLYSKIKCIQTYSQIPLQAYYLQHVWGLTFHELFTKINWVTAHTSLKVLVWLLLIVIWCSLLALHAHMCSLYLLPKGPDSDTFCKLKDEHYLQCEVLITYFVNFAGNMSDRIWKNVLIQEKICIYFISSMCWILFALIRISIH